jgi:septum formation protein
VLNSEQPCLILASTSPRRYELLRRFFPADRIQVIIPDFDESAADNRPVDHGTGSLAELLAKGKMNALIHQHILPDQSIAITADTIVTLDGRILEKPVSESDAADMLRHLSGRTHAVMTGLSVQVMSGGQTYAKTVVETTTVTFGLIDDSVIRWYLESGEPFGKAGAYGIQGLGAAFISRIDGCFYNVMGLPVYRLFAVISELTTKTGSPQLSSFISTYAGQSL